VLHPIALVLLIDTVANEDFCCYHSRLQTKLDGLLKVVPTTEAGQNLQRIMKKFHQNLFVFITHRDLPATNNGSMSKML
jgi:hypothetical protein